MKIKLTNIILIGILVSQVSLSSAAGPWENGQTFSYITTTMTSSIIEQHQEDGLISSGSFIIEYQTDYKITSIDNTDLMVSFDTLDSDGTLENITLSYNATVFGLELGDFLAIYLQFEDNNTFYLKNFSYPSYVPKLIDPDFKDINDNFKNELNASKVIDNYMDWDDLTLYDFTLGNLFNNMTSWSINEKTTLSDVKNTITDETTEYSMEFDLSGLLTTSYIDIINAEVVTIYVVYDVATISLKWEYDADGILQSFSEYEVYSYERNDATLTNEYSRTIIQKAGSYSLDAFAQPGSSIYIGIIGLLVIVIILLIYKRK